MLTFNQFVGLKLSFEVSSCANALSPMLVSVRLRGSSSHSQGDWVRVMIVQKKVQRKFLEELDMQDLKLRFYGLLVEVYLREKDAFELAQVRSSVPL